VKETKPRYVYFVMICLLGLLLSVSCSSSTGSSTVDAKTLEIRVTLPDTNNTTILVTEQGKALNSTTITSSDGNVSLSFDKGTALLDEKGKPLQFITAVIDPLIPVPPENAEIVGFAIDIQPRGAKANPSLKLTLNYDPNAFPEGISENDLWIYKYTGDTWDLMRYKQINTEANSIMTSISSFDKYSVMASTKPVEITTPLSQQSLTSITLPQALINGKPTLAEFGRGTCIPCKQMKPVLEDLAIDYQGKMNVSIVSVDEYGDLTNYYKIMAIPTQIIFDSNGKEIFRHIGFWEKEQIVAQLDKLEIK
jgi:thioredoxin 1